MHKLMNITGLPRATQTETCFHVLIRDCPQQYCYLMLLAYWEITNVLTPVMALEGCLKFDSIIVMEDPILEIYLSNNIRRSFR